MSTTATMTASNTTVCLTCDGTGTDRTFGDDCANCSGTGRKQTARIATREPVRNAATDKQIAFIESMISKLKGFEGDTVAAEDAVVLRAIIDTADQITKAVASDVITYGKGALDAAFDRQRAARAAQARQSAAELATGVYTNGTEYAVVQKARTSDNLYAKSLDFETGDTEYVPGLINRIAREGWRMLSEEERAAWGREHVRCMDCGRALTNELSRELGIGPICRSK